MTQRAKADLPGAVRTSRPIILSAGGAQLGLFGKRPKHEPLWLACLIVRPIVRSGTSARFR